MTTTVVNSISHTTGFGKDYPSLALWEAAVAINMTTTRSSTCGGTAADTAHIQLDAGASASDNFYNGLTATWTGQERLITAYVGATKVATVGALNGGASTFGGIPQSGDAFAVNAVAYDGQPANTGEYQSTANILTITGQTTSATSTITLEAIGADSWRNNGAPIGAYSQANGVGIRGTSASYGTKLVSVAVANVTLRGLQFKSPGAGHTAIVGFGAGAGVGAVIDSCLFDLDAHVDATHAGAEIGGGTHVLNCLFSHRQSISGSRALSTNGDTGTYTVVNTTFVVPSDAANVGTGTIITASYNTGWTIDNCAFFGFGKVSATDHCTTTIKNCITDLANFGTTGTGGTLTLTGVNVTGHTPYTGDFVSTLVASQDWRLKSGSVCIDAGFTDTGTGGMTAFDAFGTARPQGTAWDVGFHEFASVASFVPIGAAVPAGVAASWLPDPRQLLRPSFNPALLRKVVFYKTSQVLTLPSDFNINDNRVRCLGEGGNGAGGTTLVAGGGGGGAAYAEIQNYSAKGPNEQVSITVGAGGSFTATTWDNVNAACRADFGSSANGASGGQGGTTTFSIGTTKFVGGNGGNAGTNAGGSGGGAAGPSGAGGNAANSAATSSSQGGAADNGNLAGAAGVGTGAGNPGLSETLWLQTSDGQLAGPASGASGAGGADTASHPGGAGAAYGGAGGGADLVLTGTSAGGAGNPGLIVLDYMPTSVGSVFIPTTNFQLNLMPVV